jgi:hypothetical protein
VPCLAVSPPGACNSATLRLCDSASLHLCISAALGAWQVRRLRFSLRGGNYSERERQEQQQWCCAIITIIISRSSCRTVGIYRCNRSSLELADPRLSSLRLQESYLFWDALLDSCMSTCLRCVVQPGWCSYLESFLPSENKRTHSSAPSIEDCNETWSACSYRRCSAVQWLSFERASLA